MSGASGVATETGEPSPAPPGNGLAGPDQLARLLLWGNRLLGAVAALLLLGVLALAARAVVPVLVAILVSLMLAPPVRMLTQFRVPRVLASLLVVASAVTVCTLMLGALARPAMDWAQHAPKAIEQVARQLHEFSRPIADASKATEQITHLAQSAAGDGRQPLRVVDSNAPDAVFQVLAAAPFVIASVVVTVLLVFVFLLHGDAVLRKLVELAPDWHSKRGVVVATRDAQRELSAYVLTISLINAGLGAATAAALWLLHVPDALLWGGVAALLNYAPYIGPILTTLALTVVGIGSAHTVLLGLLPPGIFLSLHFLESFLVTPTLAGRRLALDPIMIFLGLLMFGWMWGIAGLLIAVPLLTCFKLVASRVPAWAAATKLLSA
jgi:predicted PurR-regulated permease PerM